MRCVTPWITSAAGCSSQRRSALTNRTVWSRRRRAADRSRRVFANTEDMVPSINEREALSVPAGGRALVVGPLRLGQADTPASRLAVAEVVRAVDDWSGPGVVVLAGDAFDLAAMADPSVERILGAHSRLRS